MKINKYLVVLLVLSLTSCGGSGGGSETVPQNNNTTTNDSISTTPSALVTTLQQFDPLPESNTITIDFSGEAIGYKAITSDASWLSYSTISTQEKSFQVEYSILDTSLSPGTYEAVIRYETGDFQKTNIVHTDFKLTYIVNPPDVVPVVLPDTPLNFNVISLTRAALVNWYLPPSLNFDQTTHFNLYWSTQPDFSLSSAQKIKVHDEQYTHIGLIANNSYYYKLTLEQDGLESLPTEEFNALAGESTAAPQQPINSRAYAGANNVTIKWDGAVNADAYNLYWSNAPIGDITTATQILDVTSPYLHDNLTLNSKYYYKVVAKNTFGEGLPGQLIDATPTGSVIAQESTLYDDIGRAIGVDTSGNVYTIGETYGDLTNSAIEASLIQYNTHAFIAKYNNSGEKLWIKQFDFSVDKVYFNDIVVDDIGNSYVTGYTVDDFAAVKVNPKELIIAKFDTDSTLLWKRQYTFEGSVQGKSISLDSGGNIVIASIDRPAGSDDIYLRKFNAIGELIWETSFATRQNEFFPNVTVDDLDNCILTGGSFGDLFNDGAALDGQNTFLAKLDKDGNNIWQGLVHLPELFLAPSAVSTDGTNAIYLSGTIYGTNLDGTSSGNGSRSGYLMKFDLSGNKLWEKNVGFSNITSIAVDSIGNIDVAGASTGLDIVLKKFDSNGSQLSLLSYSTDLSDHVNDIIVDVNDKIFMTGYTYGDLEGIDKITEISNSDFLLIKSGL